MTRNTPPVPLVTGTLCALGAIPLAEGRTVVGAVIWLQPDQLAALAPHLSDAITLSLPEAAE